jgi:ketosteroid isomerase-like protein
MKKLFASAMLMMILTGLAFAQNGKDEQEILKIHSSLDTAFLNKDIAVFERVLADDFITSSPTGKMTNRAEALEEIRKEWANTNYKTLSATSADMKVKVSGNMAFVTGNWFWTGAPANDPNAEPHKDTGRYTGIYEKRNGKWMLVAEHWSEAQHDKKFMEAQVMKMGQEYARLIKNQDGAAIAPMLADEYLFTNEKGVVKNKAEDLAGYKTPAKFEIFEIADQKVRVIGNNVAVETGTIRFKGTDKDGKPFDGSERYTTTWAWRDMRWQIVADHVSEIKKP